MADWVTLDQTEMVMNNLVPPPLKLENINDYSVWILASLPILAQILPHSGHLSAVSWCIYLLIIGTLVLTLGISDERNLKKAGYDTKELIVWAIMLTPVYLFRRAYICKQKYGYAITWLVTYSISMVFIIFSTLNLLFPSTDYLSLVINGSLKLYPDKTVEQIIDAGIEDPKWQVIKGEDGNIYVNITGEMRYNDKDTNIVIQYRVTKSSFTYHSMDLNGEPQIIATV